MPSTHAARRAEARTIVLLAACGLFLMAGCLDHKWNLPFSKPQPSRLEHVAAAQFEERVLKAEMPVLVDFYAEWCGPCQRLAPVLEDFAQEHPEIRVVKVNVDENRDLATRYQVTGMPTLIVFRGGQPTTRSTGLVDKAKIKGLVGGQ